MFDLRPALQLTNSGKGPELYDLLNSRHFQIENPDILPLLAALIELVPSPIEDLAEGLADEMEIDKADAAAFCDSLVDMGLLCPSDTVAAQKSGVQMWVDNGWIDALIVHFASRNLHYIDDPDEFGGQNDAAHMADIAPTAATPVSAAPPKAPSIILQQPTQDIDAPNLLSAIMNRRSFKPFQKQGFAPQDVETVLWYGNLYARELAVSNLARDPTDRDRVYDSAFSCLHTCVVLYEKLEGDGYSVEPGAYFYDVQDHALRPVREGTLRQEISRIATGQRRAGSGLMSLVLCADWEGYGQRYPHERSYRNLLINTAQLAQFYLVLLTERKFDTFMTPAIQDESMAELIGAGSTAPLYLVTAG